MKEYHYDPEYKYFLCELDAHPSPRVPGEYLISANATTLEPPEAPDGFICVFDGTSWNVIKDNRGLYYCKDTLCCFKIEDPSSSVDNLTTTTPPFKDRLPHECIKWCCDSNNWIIEDFPPPEFPDEPVVPEDIDPFENMSIEEKLGVIGLTVDELKSLFQ
jgi:hypothetical protein